VEQVKERVRISSTGARVDSLAQDVRHASRALRSSPGYAVWVIGSLAIGMAVTIAALAVLNATMVLPFPGITEQHRLVRVSVSRNCGRPNCWIRMSSPSDVAALEEGLTGLQGLAGYTAGEIPVALPEARSMRGIIASATYFEVLGVRPHLGRVFDARDAGTNAAVAVLGHSAWQREFAADPSVIGRSIRVADEFVHIVGVAPAHFIGIDRIRPGGRAPDIWLPMWLADRVLALTAAEQSRQERDLALVGRLRPEFALPQIQAEADVLARRLTASRGEEAQGALAEVYRVWRVRPESWQFGIIIVMPIPILVLVIACVNAANLMLARGSQRQREIAIRLAIGAGRGRIIRQFLIESAILALLATAVAVPIAWWGLQLASSPIGSPIPLDALVLALTVLTAAATTVAFGLAPAVRVSAQRPSSALGSAGARSDAIPRQSRMRRGLVIAQVALSLSLLATAWQLVATVRAQAVSGGTPADRLLIARFDLRPLKLADAETDRFYHELAAGASRLEGAEAAGLARHTSVWTFGQASAARSIVVWRPTDPTDEGRLTIGGYAGGDLFDAVGLWIVAGRGFTDADRQGRPQVAVVNQTFAQDMSESPIGSTLRVARRNHDFNSSIDVRIVGIIEAALEPRLSPDGPPPAKVYLPSPIEPEPALALYVRTRARATTIAQPIRELVGAIAPRVPILEIGSLEELNERSYDTQLWLARAAAFLGVIGLLLATAGLYGVSSYVVAMRSREIAIRMAVGARPGVILQMVLGQSMRVALIGLVVGGAAAVAASRVIQSEYHGIQGLDGAAFGGAAALFLIAMLLASAIPAVRASRVDPVENLKDI
jgi:putative ABC transport system permease protein